MENSRSSRAAAGGRQAGFTVVEVTIGVVVFTIVMGAIYGLLQVARGGRLNTYQRTDVLHNTRVSLSAMGRDALNSGVGFPNFGAALPDNMISTLMGGAPDADRDPDLLTPVFAQNDMRAVNGTMTDQVTFVYMDDSFNNGQALPIRDIVPSGAQVRIEVGFTNAPVQINDLYLITGQNGSAFGVATNTPSNDKVDFANSDPMNINKPGGSSPIGALDPPAVLQRVFWVTYWVSDEDGLGNGTGTLMRRVYGGPTGWVDQPMAFGVENLQIQYVLQDGSVVDAPTTLEMALIRQVRFNVALRSPDIDPRTNEPFRSTMTATYSTRNLGYSER